MKKIKIIASLFILSAVAVAFTLVGEGRETLKIGDKAPMLEYKMANTLEGESSLNQIKKSKGTLVVFSCNTCPFVVAWEDRYPLLATIAETNNIGFALVNSNEAKRNGDDSMNEMIAHAKEMGYSNIPYLVDNQSKLANAFGAKTTPHVFLFDADWKLVYEGAIDDNHKSAKEVTARYLESAMYNLSSGNAIDPNNTKAIGCSIKRVKI